MFDHASCQYLEELLNNHYLPLRERVLSTCTCMNQIHEDSDSGSIFQFNERFLQILWNEQRFSGEMCTVDGQRVEVITSGTWNVEAGPDFKDAVIRLDDEIVYGDVEVHKVPSGWKSHGHDSNPLYDNVVLHVVWQVTPAMNPNVGPPCLALVGILDRPWRMLMEELNEKVYPYARRVAPGACAVKWALMDDSSVSTVLRVAGLARFEEKSLRIRRNAIAKGFGQALYEVLFEGLGYKANKEQFRTLARSLPLAYLRGCGGSASCEAALFGKAALLPDPSAGGVSAVWVDHVRELWDAWWCQGQETLSLNWAKSGTRPFNSPERRLAAGVALLTKASLAPDVWIASLAGQCVEPRELLRCLEQALCVQSQWEQFKNFKVKLARPARLLGLHRIRDLIVNALLPFLNAYAEAKGNDSLARLVRETYLVVPGLQGNRLLDEAVHRFLVPPSRASLFLRHACEQQGLQEVYRSFCLALYGDCKNCPFVGGLPVAHLDAKQ